MLARPTRRTILTSMVLAPILTAPSRAAVAEVEPPRPSSPAARPSLSGAARSGGRYYGAAVRPEQLEQNPAFRAAVLRDCDVLTPEIHLKWNSLEWRKGQFHFTPVDDILTFSERHGMTVRGHTLLWDQSTPDWAKRELLAHRDWSLVSEHFVRVLGRYGQRIGDWDVINEPIDTQGGAGDLRRNVFHRAFGPTYIERALDEARAHAPKARLLINEYGFEYANPVDRDRRRAFVDLARRLRAADSPLDGVGVQAHLDLSKGPIDRDGLQDMAKALIDLGLDITVTELDVKEAPGAAPMAVRDQRVADETRRYLDVMMAFPEVRGVVTWGLTDRYSWLSDGPQRARPEHDPNRGLPYDADYAHKPMYWALAETLGEA